MIIDNVVRGDWWKVGVLTSEDGTLQFDQVAAMDEIARIGNNSLQTHSMQNNKILIICFTMATFDKSGTPKGAGNL